MKLSSSFLRLSSMLVLLLAMLTHLAESAPNSRKKSPNVIQLISDGFGPASETFAREYLQSKKGQPWTELLPLDKHLVGNVRTRATNSLVTDSAASATAYSCGLKSVNAYIGVDSDKKPCGTVLEGAKAKGYLTGLVSTSRITHATPASYSAHIDDRDAEDEIASQQLGHYTLGRQVDLMWGGGLRHFRPNTTKEGIRTDGRDLVEEARKDGYQIILTRSDFDNLKNGSAVQFPSLGLFTKSHMSYEIDRKPEAEPSLTEMALASLNALRQSGKPYFIMIEGARIDHAAHNNDPLGHVHDILAYNEMVEAVIKWLDENAKQNPEEPDTIMISVADHECGGLTLGLQRPEDTEGYYGWYPDVLFNGTHSTEYLASDLLKYMAAVPAPTEDQVKEYVQTKIVKEGLGIWDANEDEIKRAIELTSLKDSGVALSVWLSSIINWRAHLGWSTTGHSGVSVDLYYYESKLNKKTKSQLKALDERRSQFSGSHENTWIGEWTSKFLGLDLESITKTLNNGSDYSWYDNWGDKLNNFTEGLEHYHGGLARVVPPKTASQQAAATKRDFEVGYSHAENYEIMRRMYEDREKREPSHQSMADRSHSHAKREL
ncbi:putative PHO8-repressible alkaline phosphatase vacuolar [Violaceomyces palustris]|uniref:PHO8-repressible alkaline phosphatase vacuolar n=1 Tax=Violaceomyces palustris TaxID=1673888 RepID=A0ACD0P3H3_9BASI|nr:putative PHO8-repressible alkaline phosphatase vacuolar [Violaceomyces palustris]